MAVVRKGPKVQFKCRNFVQRHNTYEANDLLEEAAEVVDELEAEIDRLRAALEEIADPYRHGWSRNSMPEYQHIARAALAEGLKVGK